MRMKLRIDWKLCEKEVKDEFPSIAVQNPRKEEKVKNLVSENGKKGLSEMQEGRSREDGLSSFPYHSEAVSSSHVVIQRWTLS